LHPGAVPWLLFRTGKRCGATATRAAPRAPLAVTRHHDTVILILNEDRVLNRYLTRSYVLVGPAALRIRMGQATSRRALLILQLHTLIY